MSKVLMVASEAVPFVKTGGLADVVGSLPAGLTALGDEVAVVLPWYRQSLVPRSRQVLDYFPVWLGAASYTVRIHQSDAQGVPFYLVECPLLYDRPGVYADAGLEHPDNHIRFAVLSRAALVVARRLFRPAILHCHDWQAALVPVYLRSMLAGDPTFFAVKTLLTIHNLGYQGIFARSQLEEMGLGAAAFHPGMVEFFGDVNLLKGGIASSDAINAVSPSYAAEIQTLEYGFKLDGLLRARGDAVSGILNGVDYSEWDPATDRHIAANYSPADLAGKRECKRDLLARFGFPAETIDRPLVGIVSRFASQKGFDLLEQAGARIASEDVTLVALGTGEPRYEKLFLSLAAEYPGKFAVRVAYDEPLSHQIEAAADIFLMPSRYEPCGLNQIYSLRYGAVPVVRATGGLDDTIDEETGFKFKEYTPDALVAALRTALAAFRDRERWQHRMLNGMARDYSWSRSAARYSELYRRLELESRRAAPTSYK